MPLIVQFDLANGDILNIRRLPDPAPFIGQPDILIDPVAPADGKWQRNKVVGGLIVLRPQVELDALDAAEVEKSTARSTLLSLKNVTNPTAAQIKDALRALIVLQLSGRSTP